MRKINLKKTSDYQTSKLHFTKKAIRVCYFSLFAFRVSSRARRQRFFIASHFHGWGSSEMFIPFWLENLFFVISTDSRHKAQPSKDEDEGYKNTLFFFGNAEQQYYYCNIYFFFPKKRRITKKKFLFKCRSKILLKLY